MTSARFHLRAPAGFSFDRTVRSHGWYDLPPFRYDRDAGTLDLAFHCAGRVVKATLRASGTGVSVVVSSDAGARREATRVLRQVLRLDDDLAAAYAVLDGASELRRCAEAGGGRLLRAPTVFEDTVKMLCTTNCSWSLTRVMVGQLVENLGEPAPGGDRAFPLPAALAAQPERFFRDVARTGYRAPFLKALAERVAGGELDLEGLRDPALPTDDVRARLRSIKGIGDYAADNLLRLLGRYDRLGLDSWCRATFLKLYPRTRKATLDAAIARRYRRFAPYQGLAMWLDLTRHWHD